MQPIDMLPHCRTRRLRSSPPVAALVWAALTCASLPASALAAGLPSTNVAWLPAASPADIDAAFARAKSERKPLLLYWGATWCPPCNQLKATLFNRQEFATLSKNFVAVHVDGDRPGAQKLGARFKVNGYPSTLLLTPEGQEITRLPGEVDPPQALGVLQLGLAGGRPVQAVLAEAKSGKALSANEWRSLAFYSWETDEQRLVPRAQLPHLLASLAQGSAGPANSARDGRPAAGDDETTTRLWLKALAASDDGKGLKADDTLRQRVQRVLADAALVRTHADVLSNNAPDIVRTLEDELSPRRATLVQQFEVAMRKLEADTTLSRADRLQALLARVELARLTAGGDLGQPKLPDVLLAQVREHAARADREITDGYERQAVITAAGYMLGRAGLWAESEALLKANLARSHSPYYLMSQLGSNARKQGKKDEALNWFGQAFDTAKGPATRLQWGSSYLGALVDLAPQDSARIEKLASQLLSEAASDSAAFEGRSSRALKRSSDKLLAWNQDGKHAAAIRRLQHQVDGLCAKVDAADGQRATCQLLLKAPA